MTKEEYALMSKIVARSHSMGIGGGDHMTRVMDVEFAHETFNMRLEDWLNADDFNFAHDFLGIQNSVDRKNRAWRDEYFLPRFAGKMVVTA